MSKKRQIFSVVTLASTLYLPVWSHAADASTPAKKADVRPTPTAREIIDAKAKGLVWADLAKRVYQRDGPAYGKTRGGKFMTEDEARQTGLSEAKQTKSSPKNSSLTKAHSKKDDRQTSGTDDTINTHRGSTPPPTK